MRRGARQAARLRLLVTAYLAAAGVAAGQGAAPPQAGAGGVSAGLRVEPDEAYLHEQVVLELFVTHPIDARPRWQAPAFEGFWTERLASKGGSRGRDSGGRVVRQTRFRRALFPTRSGELPIAGSKLRYRDAAGVEQTLDVPGLTVRVRPLPEAVPGGAVVGEVQLEARLSASQIPVGSSTRLLVDYYGSGNLWDAPLDDLESALGPDIEVFADRPLMTRGERNGQLTTRRRVRYELVPRASGRFAIPGLRLRYFDPASGSYRMAATEPLELRVGPAGTPVVRSEGAARSAVPSLPWRAALVALVATGLAVAFGLTRWWRRALRAVLGPPPPSPRVLLARARDGVGSDRFPRLLRDALEAGVHARYHFDPSHLTTDEIAERIDDPAALELLRSLDQLRFSGRVERSEQLLESVQRYLGL